MAAVGSIWRLHAGDDEIADLFVTGQDFPWLHAELRPTAAFGRFRELFEAEAAASEAEDWDTADELYERIRAEVRMTDPEGQDVPEFLLHIEGAIAWWRWSDERFTASET